MADSKLDDMLNDMRTMLNDMRTMIIHERDYYEKVIKQLREDLQKANSKLFIATLNGLQGPVESKQQELALDKPIILEKQKSEKWLTPEIVAQAVKYVDCMEVGKEIDALSLYYEITGKMIIGQGPRRVWSNFLKNIKAIQPVIDKNNEHLKAHNYLGKSPAFRKIEIKE